MDIEITKNYDKVSIRLTVKYQLKSLRKDKSQDRSMSITRNEVSDIVR